MRAQAGAPEGLWLRAEQQSGGRGRLGREWISPPGNLYVSTLVRLRESDPPASSLAFVAAVALHEQIIKCVEPDSVILKWPNDVLINGNKTSGILLERVGDSVVIGIGVNISFTPELTDRIVTSLHGAGADTRIDAAMFLTDLAPTFAKKLEEWRTLDLATTLNAWSSRAHAIGAQVSVTQSDGSKIRGEYQGIESDGALRLSDHEGRQVVIHAGDVDLI